MIKEAEHNGPKINGLRAKGSNGICTSRPSFSLKSDLMSKHNFNNTGEKHIIHFMDWPVVFLLVPPRSPYGTYIAHLRTQSYIQLNLPLY